MGKCAEGTAKSKEQNTGYISGCNETLMPGTEVLGAVGSPGSSPGLNCPGLAVRLLGGVGAALIHS